MIHTEIKMNDKSCGPVEFEIRKFMKRCDRIILDHKTQERFHCLDDLEDNEKRRDQVEKDLNSLDT